MLRTIKASGRGQKLVDKKSRFFCSIYKVTSKEEAEDFLERIRKKFPKASHHAYAYRLGSPVHWEDSSDDGEVRGCAGKPIMTILKKKKLTNLIVVVTRYYGGINLGAGGLVKNYSKCALELIDIIGIKKIEKKKT
ncbi:MAG: hypothetical protein GF308_14215 [Candidatus Heimdallarchaeota archaeon]|nr:hypothetical protein [Candidatus Heimdallarchaeota archaeon]